jgi:hypothetical protein
LCEQFLGERLREWDVRVGVVVSVDVIHRGSVFDLLPGVGV